MDSNDERDIKAFPTHFNKLSENSLHIIFIHFSSRSLYFNLLNVVLGVVLNKKLII